MMNQRDNNLTNFGNVGNTTKSMSINAVRNIAETKPIPKANPYLEDVTKNISQDIGQIINQTYISSLNHIILGFMLASALAWHEAVKFFISRSIKFNKGNPMYYIYYAGSITILSALLFTFTKKYISKKVKEPKIMYAVTG